MPITPRSVVKNHAVEFLENVRQGVLVAKELIELGACVYCPANDFVYWLVGAGPSMEQIYKQDLSLIQHSDALVVLPGWDSSENCRREINTARNGGLLVFFYPSEIEKIDTFIREWKGYSNG